MRDFKAASSTVAAHRRSRARLRSNCPIRTGAADGDADVGDVAGMVVRLGHQYAVYELARNIRMGMTGQDHIDPGHFIGQELDKVLIPTEAIGFIKPAVSSHDDYVCTGCFHDGHVIVGSSPLRPQRRNQQCFPVAPNGPLQAGLTRGCLPGLHRHP